MNEQKRRGGFTLLEMLVIIGIIGILIAVLLPSFNYVMQIARQTRAQELVGNAMTALTAYVQRERSWPDEILLSRGYFDDKVCKVLQEAGFLDVTTYNGNEINQNSPERFGLLDPWGQNIVRKNPKLSATSRTGQTAPEEIRNHILQFRIDRNLDGKVDAADCTDGFPPIPRNQSIRAVAIVWSRGPSGKDDSSSGKYPRENRLSWALGQ